MGPFSAIRFTKKAILICSADLETNEILRLALTKLVEIIREAAKQVTEVTRTKYPDVPWSAAARMRDRLVHHYFDVDLDILWSTIAIELPQTIPCHNAQSVTFGNRVWGNSPRVHQSLVRHVRNA